ncbi:YpmS family protein [Bacillus sp. EB106-08-02-XG196]|uniref:YpmS family protein n=1 Tax=Bacillus sp. EB106-08-02-XG196 TaxID=2737049 RepID=UPI0015C46BB7|nr:YpmS family protein [Bacillus sp. EB106-08-02-XG196]NWQ42170.1 YpmS family protein [Bacillus sp. EB106-08-02-XG196]
MKNKWKTGFFLIVGLNLFIVIILLSLIMVPADEKGKIQSVPDDSSVSFQVKSNKADLNVLINQYIKKEAADSPIDYSVQLQDEVELYGTLKFFSQEVDLKLTFVPEALDNGDLVLKQKSISVGSLPLPVSYVLKFIKDNYKLPKGVDILPNDKMIHVHMQQLKLKSDVKIKANKFDLVKDDIAFTIVVPVE